MGLHQENGAGGGTAIGDDDRTYSWKQNRPQAMVKQVESRVTPVADSSCYSSWRSSTFISNFASLFSFFIVFPNCSCSYVLNPANYKTFFVSFVSCFVCLIIFISWKQTVTFIWILFKFVFSAKFPRFLFLLFIHKKLNKT